MGTSDTGISWYHRVHTKKMYYIPISLYSVYSNVTLIWIEASKLYRNINNK